MIGTTQRDQLLEIEQTIGDMYEDMLITERRKRVKNWSMNVNKMPININRICDILYTDRR